MKILWFWSRSASERNQKSSPEEVVLVKTLMPKVITEGFKLVDEAMAIFEEHDPDCMRSSKVRMEMENALYWNLWIPQIIYFHIYI